MNLREAIYQILHEADRPMTSREVADMINALGLYYRKDKAPLSATQITARISQHPQEFDYVQGEIILSNNSYWSEIIRSHKYILDLLRNLERGEKGTMVVFLLFYKRISDLSDAGYNYQLPLYARIKYLRNDLAHSHSSFLFDGFRSGVNYLENEFPQAGNFFFQHFEIFISLEVGVVFEILNALSHFETSQLEDRKFGRIFEYLIQKSFNGNKDDYYFTPQPIAELFGNLADLDGVSNVYDPCAGLGGLFTEINKQARNSFIQYFATDLNARVSSLGILNLICNGIRQFEFINSDCLLDPFKLKFDLIVSNLPLISRINDSIDFNFIHHLGLPTPTKKSGTAVFILYSLSKLRQGGKAFLMVPEGFLFKKGYDEIVRQFLINNGLLDAVISLPSTSLNPYTSAKVSILCLSSHSNNQVKFINGAIGIKQFDEISNRESSVDDIINAYKRSDGDTQISTVIPVSAIRRNDYILSVDKYSEIYRETNRLLEEGNAQYLDSLVSIQSGSSVKNVSELPEEDASMLWDDSRIQIIKSENLKKDILNTSISKEDVLSFVKKDERVDRFILREKCILIARFGDNPKPTIFDPKDFEKPVIVHQGVFALIPQTNSPITVEYLYYQFYTPFVLQQLTNAKVGLTVPFLSKSNLAKLVIPVVDIKEQNKLVSTQRANLIQLEKENIEKRLRMLGYEREVADKESDIVRILVHQLRPSFLSLDSQVGAIIRIVKKYKLEDFKEFDEDIQEQGEQELLALGIEPNKPSNHSLKIICDKLMKDSKDINDKLTYVNKVMTFNLGKDDFLQIGIKAFILSRIDTLKVNNPLKFNIEVIGEECIVDLNTESMGELIDQLINNAQAHAYDIHNPHNLLRFNIKINKQSPIVSIDYSNNGKEFKLTLEQLISPFQKSQNSNGTGIGGYYIKRIVDAHNGTLILNDKVKKGFALTIELPITQKSNTYE